VQNTNTNEHNTDRTIKQSLQVRAKQQILNALKEYGNKPYSPDLRDKVREAILQAV
jgi:hypothetical protein